MNNLKPVIFPLAVLVISIYLIVELTPEYHPFGSLEIKSSKKEILKKASEYLQLLGIKDNVDNYNIDFQSDKKFIQWINSRYKLDEANEKIKKLKSGYFWNVSQSSNNEDIVVSTSNSSTPVMKARDINLKIIDDGDLIEIENSSEDTSSGRSLSVEEAKKLVIIFAGKIRGDLKLSTDSSFNVKGFDQFRLTGIETTNKVNRLEHIFTFKNSGNDGINQTLTAKIVGSELKLFRISNDVPKEFLSDREDIFQIVSTILYVLLIVIAVVIVGFKKFRAYELGLKLAVIFGILVLLSFISKELLEHITTFKFSMILGLGLGGVFIAGAGIVLWAVSETIFRETWNNKFLVFDLLLHKKFFHSIVTRSIINGISFGAGLTAFFYLSLFLVSNYSSISFLGDNFNSFTHISATIPLGNLLFGIFNSYAFIAVSFFMFLAAGIKRYINSDLVFLVVSSLVWALIVPSKINPITIAIPINFIFGFILNLILFKYDLLTTFLSYLSFEFLIKANEFLFISDANLHSNWSILVLGLSVIVIILTIFQLRKDKFTDYDSITPKFVENITERQRLKRELEVARVVQMSFLPSEDPKLSGIDISSICIPALEVGGDYYDFIKLNNNKLGIIIGDVSGKGTQAAFYMTLTKGFLKALAKQTDSPSEVLIKMNELFYENVERGRFISMVYAIIDYDKMELKIARAGHNPIITNDLAGKISLINPKGIALGLEKGELFKKVITEHHENLDREKVYIFYTDGFTEATNKYEEEYGLERMYKIVQDYSYCSAKEIQQKLMEDVNKFIGKCKQHDDMTMVILKVK